MAWLLETVGLKVYLLTGGYKVYRNHVLDYFDRDYKILLLGGCTGSGKTDILPILEDAGEQIIDLEGLANHKGSAFGAIGQNAQPSSEYFEHLLFNELVKMDSSRAIWVEDESRNVGRVFIPQGFWDRMRSSALVRLDTSYQVRLDRIMRDYACFDPADLAVSIKKIEKRLGFDKCKTAYESCMEGDISLAAKICLDYYDRLYNDSLSKRFAPGTEAYFKVSIDSLELESALPELLKIVKKYNEK